MYQPYFISAWPIFLLLLNYIHNRFQQNFNGLLVFFFVRKVGDLHETRAHTYGLYLTNYIQFTVNIRPMERKNKNNQDLMNDDHFRPKLSGVKQLNENATVTIAINTWFIAGFLFIIDQYGSTIVYHEFEYNISA